LAEDTNAKPKHLVMDNPRLALRSEIFQDDSGHLVEKRCFLLCCGEDDVITDFLSMRLSVNVFDEPRAPKKLEVTFKLK
jgi:hypothetical protein